MPVIKDVNEYMTKIHKNLHDFLKSVKKYTHGCFYENIPLIY